MVLPGQFLERPALIPVGEWVLEGVAHRGERQPALLVVSPPPWFGGSMDHVAGAELAWACSQAGHSTLRFNFRGVGASQGPQGDAAACLDDIRAALKVLRETIAHERVAVAFLGASSQFVAALAQADGNLAGFVCVCPEHALAIPEGVPLLALVPEMERDVRDTPWARALSSQGVVELIAGADKTFQCGLPFVGRRAATFLGRL